MDASPAANAAGDAAVGVVGRVAMRHPSGRMRRDVPAWRGYLSHLHPGPEMGHWDPLPGPIRNPFSFTVLARDINSLGLYSWADSEFLGVHPQPRRAE